MIISNYIRRCDALNVLDLSYRDVIYVDKEIIADRIRSITSADVVEVVRCKYCIAYNTEEYAEGCGFCLYHQSVMKADGYCSEGRMDKSE